MLYSLSFLLSFLVNFYLVASNVERLFIDKTVGVQKFHKGRVSRAGGLGIFTSFFLFLLFVSIQSGVWNYILLVFCPLPVFLKGLREDMSHNVLPKERLIFALFSALLAVVIFDLGIKRIDVFLFDGVLSVDLIAYAFAVFAIAGMVNAINIIDGFNGLASGVSLMILISVAVVASKVGNEFVLTTSLIMVASILGFFVLNFPFGKIFLGDGGAYLIGFVIAVLVIHLVKNSDQVSPWYAFTVLSYPVIETLFSAYRKKVVRSASPFEPDRVHFHMLVYKRLTDRLFRGVGDLYRNSLTSVIIWVFALPPILIATVFYQSTPILMVTSVAFIVVYIAFYTALVRFKLGRLVRAVMGG